VLSTITLSLDSNKILPDVPRVFRLIPCVVPSVVRLISASLEYNEISPEPDLNCKVPLLETAIPRLSPGDVVNCISPSLSCKIFLPLTNKESGPKYKSLTTLSGVPISNILFPDGIKD
jgi:hypothetical protein